MLQLPETVACLRDRSDADLELLYSQLGGFLSAEAEASFRQLKEVEKEVSSRPREGKSKAGITGDPDFEWPDFEELVEYLQVYFGPPPETLRGARRSRKSRRRPPASGEA
jgi:hypothetical protein